MISLEEIYTSVACNRLPGVVDWNNKGFICYGATNSLIIWDTNGKGKNPLRVYTHHKSIVKSVKWIYNENEKTHEILSCSADMTAAVWSSVDGRWVVTSELLGHKGAVTCIHGVYGDNLIVFTASIDATIKIWNRNNGMIENIQTINLNTGLCLTLHAFMLPTKKPILLSAVDDCKIHVYAGSEEYRRVHSLTGHEDWVRGLDVMNIDENSVMVASGSQDSYIRLWKIQRHVENQLTNTNSIEVEKKLFSVFGTEWSVELNAVLAGHEGWVYGVQWLPISQNKDCSADPSNYQLLSSSMDKMAIIWEPEQKGGAWVEKVRVGNVGGNGLGFYGTCFGPRGKSFLAHGYNGSFHIWMLDQTNSQWRPCVVYGGHFNSVEDVRWEPVHGRYIVSVSLDQTTRIHAPWKRSDDHGIEWHEIARPQVHGYDLVSIAPVSSSKFASAADEKVIRTFDAPHNFIANFRSLIREDLLENGDFKVPEGASVPSLGLSNKAVYSDTEKINTNKRNVTVTLTEPPTEECLMENTLWPETHKLYGHGYEVFSLDASPDGSLLASSCKATNMEHAAILIWDTANWQQIQTLPSHNLTVTQLAFSPKSDHILSVSRDRRWTLFRRRQGSNLFDVTAYTDKTNGVHTRIIWCCAWSRDGQIFGTGSRDGKVCLWSKTGNYEDTSSSIGEYGLYGYPLELKNSSITALDFAPIHSEARRVLALGLETGIIRIYNFVFNTGWSLLYEMENSLAHHLTVKKLSFKPRKRDDDEVLLASCGADHFVRIYSLVLS